MEVPVEEVSLLDIPGVLNVSTRKGSVQYVSSLGKVESRDQNHGLFREGLEVRAIQFEVKGCKIKKVFASKML